MAEMRDVGRLGEAVYLRRCRLGLSQMRLAEEAGVSTTTVRNVENGRVGERRIPSLPSIELALGWMPGSGERILAGGDPELLETDEPGRHGGGHEGVVDLSEVPLNDLRAELDRRIEALVEQAMAENPDIPRPSGWMRAPESESEAWDRGIASLRRPELA